ncbi:CehA/McbA family metallohydrolase [Paenibacillus filicis]|uniref:CehA/McbA family metallohydrolase n=1 Tax=Paenibacillus gyeongsangnamensis TaxID=3388067 RepID=A0ABT4QIE0_9BACL|nr:CehA/McbA family metallohydrolase [Paenibacillus filicis]MCZ8516633.1 CehA/McbA family metallohydrolase [Paenibacillus filicis]
MEVWSGTFPSIKTDNAQTFRLWTEKLNEGFRIAATSGRDWHTQDSTNEPVSVTYLNIEDTEESITIKAVRAFAAGKASVTIGPLVTMEIHFNAISYGIGTALPRTEQSHYYKVNVEIDFCARQGIWEFSESNYWLTIMSNTGVLGEHSVSQDQAGCLFDIASDEILWVRAELWGNVHGVRTLIAFTNAIYFDR